jgi:hypothetical protein
MSNHWNYKIYLGGLGFEEYVAETSPGAVKADLESANSLLYNYLQQSRGTDAEEFSRRHPLETEELLGGLVARSDCLQRHSSPVEQEPVAVPFVPPFGTRVHGPPASQPEDWPCGVKLWRVRSADRKADA